MKNFKKLMVWQKSIELVKSIYQVTNGFPKTEVFGLTSQIRRACVSIPSNIAEGSGRSEKEYYHFLNIPKGSAFELETQFLISFELDFINNNDFQKINTCIIEIQKMLSGLQNKLNT